MTEEEIKKELLNTRRTIEQKKKNIEQQEIELQKMKIEVRKLNVKKAELQIQLDEFNIGTKKSLAKDRRIRTLKDNALYVKNSIASDEEVRNYYAKKAKEMDC